MMQNDVQMVMIHPSGGVGYDRMVRKLVDLDRNGILELLSLTILSRDNSGEFHLEEVSEAASAEKSLLKALSADGLGLYISILKSVISASTFSPNKDESVSLLDLDLSSDRIRNLASEIPYEGKVYLALLENTFVETLRNEMADLIADLAIFDLAVQDSAAQSSGENAGSIGR